MGRQAAPDLFEGAAPDLRGLLAILPDLSDSF
jgi:hypothetical protein